MQDTLKQGLRAQKLGSSTQLLPKGVLPRYTRQSPSKKVSSRGPKSPGLASKRGCKLRTGEIAALVTARSNPAQAVLKSAKQATEFHGVAP